MCPLLDLTPLTDSGPLAWWAGRVLAGTRVRSWLPDLFEGYVRILHPAYIHDEVPGGVVLRPVAWSTVSQWSGKPLDKETCIDDLLRRTDGALWSERGSSPYQGRLDPTYMSRLAELLASATNTPEELWSLVWAGYGAVGSLRHEDVELEINPSWRGSGRTYLLFRGSIGASAEEDDAEALGEPTILLAPPSFWWPTDRKWFVATDIDSFSTYVGGSDSLAKRLLGDDLLEIVPVSLDDVYDPCSESPSG